MKIIKAGTIERKTETFICLKCSTIFEADETEYTNADQMEYMHDGIRCKCKCPVCGTMVYVER